MKKLLTAVTVVALSVSTSFASAAEQKVSGFYLVGAVGTTGLSATEADADIGPGKSDYSKGMDTSDMGFKLLGGYQFNRSVGVEGAYTNYGEFKAKHGGYKVSPTAFSVAANLGYTFDNGVRPFALVGLSSFDLSESGGDQFEDDSATAFHYGVGVEFSPVALNGVAFRATLEGDVFAVSTTGYDDSSIGLSMLSVGATYKF